MDSKEHTSVFRAAGLISLITLISRFSGLIRDAIMAAVFGGGRYNDVFQTSFELSNLLRRVMGEGALSAFIVPLLERRRGESGREAGWLFFNRCTNLMMLISITLTLTGMFFSKQVFIMFGGAGLLKTGELEFIDLGASLTRLMFPYMAILTAASAMMGACHTLRSFGPPAWGSIMINLTMIITGSIAWLIKPGLQPACYWIAWALLIGVTIRVLIMVPVLFREGWRWSPSFSLRDPDLRLLLWTMLPGIMAMGVSQINIAVSGYFAMYLGEGVKSAVTFATRLIQFPMALTATAAATAMLPQIANYLRERRMRELCHLLNRSKRLESLMIAPSILGLMMLGLPIVGLVFERGAWSADASINTYLALVCYAPGLLPQSWSRLLEPVFFARYDRKTPLKAALLSVFVSICLNWFFAFHTSFGVMGLALSGTLAAFVYYGALAWRLHCDEPELHGIHSQVFRTIFHAFLASGITCGMAAWVYWKMVWFFGEPHGSIQRMVMLMPLILMVAVSYALLLRWMGSNEIEAIWLVMKRKLRLQS